MWITEHQDCGGTSRMSRYDCGTGTPYKPCRVQVVARHAECGVLCRSATHKGLSW